MHDLLAAHEKHASFSGSVLVSKNGEVLFDEGFGLADRGNRMRNTGDMVYPLASVSIG